MNNQNNFKMPKTWRSVECEEQYISLGEILLFLKKELDRFDANTRFAIQLHLIMAWEIMDYFLKKDKR